MKDRRQSLLTRLTLVYMAVLGSVLLLFAAGTDVLLFWQLQGQLRRHAIQDLETVEGLLYFAPDGVLGLHEDYHNHPESKRIQERLLEVLSPEGAVLYRNERLETLALGGSPARDEGVGGYSPRSTRLANGERVLLVSRRHILNGHPLLIRVAYSLEPIWLRVEEWAAASLLVLPLALAAAGFSAYALARRALAPLEQMALRAERITADRLDERLPESGANDELGRLARVFNDTLGRLEQAFQQLRRFTSDAAHELRTPLAAMRSVGEVGLQKDATPEQYRDVIGSMLEEVNRLTELTESLLSIARADSGRLHLNPTVFPALDLLRESSGVVEVLMEEKWQTLTVAGDENAAVNGDRVLLRQAFINILHNAMKYSPAGGTITARVRPSPPGRVAIEIEDSGPGIAPEHCQRVFDRFYRVDSARSREAGGAGLGLSIAKWAVEANGGKIGLECASGRGCTFRIELPQAANPAAPAAI